MDLNLVITILNRANLPRIKALYEKIIIHRFYQCWEMVQLRQVS